MGLSSITHINSYFITSQLHGELVAALDGKGITQKVYVPVPRKNLVGKNKPEKLQHAEIYYSKCFGAIDRWLWPLKMERVWQDFKKRFSSDSSKVLHAHSLITNGLIAYHAHKKWGTPYIVSVRFTDIHFFLEKGLFFQPLALKVLKNARGIVFLSPAYRNDQIKRFFSVKDYQMILSKSIIMPNGINEFWLKNKHQNKKLSPKRKLVFVGSLIKRKNPSALIAACEILNKEDFTIELTIVGVGHLLDNLKNKAHTTKIDFLGNVSDRYKLMKVYHESDILVVPSFIETFGLVYPEAMSQGLPVIYTRGQGFDGYFPDGHVGYAVNPKNPHDIAEKIKLVYQDYDRISTNAFNESALFSWENVSDKLISLYKDVLTQTEKH